jgi:fructose-specific phosphotransferase system IIC component
MVAAIPVDASDSMRKIYIYLIGITLFGLLHAPVRSAVPHGAIFLLIAIVYLVALRLVAEKFGKP